MQTVEHTSEHTVGHARLGRPASWALLLASALILTPTPADALVVDVRSTTALVLEVFNLGTRPRLELRLIDNVHQGVDGHEVAVTVTPTPRRGEPQQLVLTTDALGFARTELTLPEGSYTVLARFDGSAFLQAAAQESAFEVRRARLQLEADIPAHVHEGAEGSFEVDVRATVPFLIGDGLAVEVSAGSGTSGFRETVLLSPIAGKGAGVDDAFVEATALRGVVSVPLRIGHGYQPVMVAFRGDDYFIAASVQRDVMLLRRPEMRVSAEEVRDRSRRGIAIYGDLTSADGPIARGTVQIEANAPQKPSQTVARLTTQADGHFEGFVPADTLPVGEVLVRVAFLPDAGKPLRSEAMKMTLEGASATGWAMWTLLGLFGVILSAMLAYMAIAHVQGWLRLLRLRRRRPVSRPEVVLEEVEGPASTPHAYDTISGVLFDTTQQRPIAPGVVRVVPAGAVATAPPVAEVDVARDGTFTLDKLPHGRYRIWGSAFGYVSAHARVRIPHDGTLRFVRLHLVPVRERVREIYDWLLEQYAPDDLIWGWQTPREVELELLGQARQLAQSIESADASATIRTARLALAEPVPSLASLLNATTRLLEEVYYSPRLFPEEVATLAEALAQTLRDPLVAAASAERRGRGGRVVGPLRPAGDL